MARSSDDVPTSAATRILRLGPALLACAASVVAIATLAPETGGPGMACDEPYHVGYGKRLVMTLRHQGFSFFTPANIRRNFDWHPGGPPVHPPLGNWLLGWTHFVFDRAPDDPRAMTIVAARFAPALAFGVLVFLVGWSVGRMEGPIAAVAASAAVFLTPRVFGHAHLAALDTITAVFFVAAAIAVVEADLRGGKLGWYALAGAIWGLALLTRLHGVLLLPPVAVWMVWRLRIRALLRLAVWGLAGGATLFVGWPWLWLDPIGHLRQFLGTATDRMPLHVFYMGQAWDDHAVPRHYALVMFAVTLPLGLLILGCLGLWARRKPSHSPPGFFLFVGTIVFLLGLFSWPGVPVYDGVRLFLMVFPLWTVAVGVGAKWLVEHPAWASRSIRLRIGLVGGLVAAQGLGLALYHPCYLSYYSLLVGGLPGAHRLGFEVDYWGDAVTESLLSQLAAKAQKTAVVYGPNLAPFQAPMVGSSSASLNAKQILVIGWDGGGQGFQVGCRYGVFYHRLADLGGIPSELLDGKVLAEQRVLGVWTARVVEFADPIGRGTLVHLAPRRAPPPPLSPPSSTDGLPRLQ